MRSTVKLHPLRAAPVSHTLELTLLSKPQKQPFVPGREGFRHKMEGFRALCCSPQHHAHLGDEDL